MRRVRGRFHQAAGDILLMRQGNYRRDQNTPYAKRIRAAMQHVDLPRLEERFYSNIFLTPNFEREDKTAAWGEEEDLAIAAIVYGIPFVSLSDYNGYAPLCGYGVNGKRYETVDFENPGIMNELVSAERQHPLMLIADMDHWDPLVADR